MTYVPSISASSPTLTPESPSSCVLLSLFHMDVLIPDRILEATLALPSSTPAPFHPQSICSTKGPPLPSPFPLHPDQAYISHLPILAPVRSPDTSILCTKPQSPPVLKVIETLHREARHSTTRPSHSRSSGNGNKCTSTLPSASQHTSTSFGAPSIYHTSPKGLGSWQLCQGAWSSIQKLPGIVAALICHRGQAPAQGV